MDRITELKLELQKLEKEEFEKKREEFSKFIGKSFRLRLKWNDEYRYVRIMDITNITETDIVVEGVMVDFTRKGQKN